ncbi:MAG: aldolase/citrate lyase family protein [Pseudomonadota bacterium]
MGLKAMMVVSDPDIAAFVASEGLDRLFVDLEVMGKAARQPGDTWKSALTLADVPPIRAAAPEAEMLVRLNPPHAETGAEVAGALAAGADLLMVPMVREAREVAEVLSVIDGRCGLVPLIETASGLAAIEDIAALGPSEVYFGLNDLHLDLGARFMFEPLADGRLDGAAEVLRTARIPFGIGGVARAGDGAVPAELILGEHARLGSQWVILSRGFYGRATTVSEMRVAVDFSAELARLKAIHADHIAAGSDDLAANHRRFVDAVSSVVARVTPQRRPGA